MTSAAVFSSRFQPSRDTFRGALMLRLASGGADLDELVDDFTDLAADFGQHFPADEPVRPQDVPDVVDEVIVEYQRVVTEMSPDAEALLAALEHLHEAGILFSYGDGVDSADSREYLAEAYAYLTEQGAQIRGYLFSSVEDLDRLVLESRLQVTFGTFDADASPAAVVAEALAVFIADGLAAQWSGDVADPIVIAPMVVDAPLVVADEGCGCGDGCACEGEGKGHDHGDGCCGGGGHGHDHGSEGCGCNPA